LSEISKTGLENKGAHPFVGLCWASRVGGGSGGVDDESELGVKLISYLVGLLGVIGHDREDTKAMN
jgi:hypothetical protein